MSIIEAGAAFRTWAARHGLAPNAAAAQVAEENARGELVSQLDLAFGNLDQPLTRALNARRVHAVAVNEVDDKLIVYVSKGFTAKQIEKLPCAFDGHALEYRPGAIGQIGGLPPSGLGSPSHYLHQGRVTCGSSVGLGGSMCVGTLGALVRVGGELFGLSNNHVIGRCSYAESGHPVLIPGNLDINPYFLRHPFTGGVFESAAPMVYGAPANVNVAQNLDAALMRIVDDTAVSAMQGGAYQTPAVVAQIADNMLVQKVGRTTGHTRGRVTGKIAGFQSISYTIPELNQNFNVFFNEAWIVEGQGGPFSDSGDSGSLVVGELANGQIASVGLVFAGNGTISLVAPLDLILSHFNATIEALHGV
jgi:hypothetical protein